MLSLLIALIFSSIAINLCLRFIFKTSPRRIIYDSLTQTTSSTDYLRGYLNGITNVKMYYYVVGDMPSSNWLDSNKFHILNSRQLLVKTLDEETKRGAGIIDEEREV